MDALVLTVMNLTTATENKIANISAGSDIPIGEMFQLQLAVNRLAQITEASTNIISSGNTLMQSMARNVK
jgi:hypothetical protein